MIILPLNPENILRISHSEFNVVSYNQNEVLGHHFLHHTRLIEYLQCCQVNVVTLASHNI